MEPHAIWVVLWGIWKEGVRPHVDVEASLLCETLPWTSVGFVKDPFSYGAM